MIWQMRKRNNASNSSAKKLKEKSSDKAVYNSTGGDEN